MSDQGINLYELPIPQLQAVGQQLEQEIQVLSSSFAQLKQAQAKFNDASDSLKKIHPNPSNQASVDGREVLVPLTNSLYVPGTLDGLDKVIVDVGTGYFMEKTIPQAAEYFKRKIDFVKGNLSKLEEQVNQRQNQRKILYNVLQQKMLEAKSQESGNAVAAN